MKPWLSQTLGLTLAVFTAIGCIAYEKVVKHFSFGMVTLLTSLFTVPVTCVWYASRRALLWEEVSRLTSDKQLLTAGLLYWLTWVTAPLWYIITRKQNVMAGSIYEMKYVMLLAVFYFLFGDKPMTMSLFIGVCLAVASLWFISKT
jgi:hypothetical protein